MSISVSEFTIEELWGYQTFRIPIQDNKFVLVGENGTGKSTVANLIYFFLTRQWQKINDFDFKEISTIINGEKLSISKKDLNETLDYFRGYKSASLRFSERTRYSIEYLNFIISEEDVSQYIENPDKLKNLSSELRISPLVIRDILQRKIERMEGESNNSSNTQLKIVNEAIKKIVKDQILYLPTYRRIEQELKAIFPDLDSDFELSLHRERKISRRRKQKDYVELIEFGMEDVEQTINSKMDDLKDSVRNRLENLTGTYLSDVISKEYQKIEVQKLEDLDNETVESIFSRIDEKILSQREKTELRNMLDNIKNEGRIKEDQKVIAHFLLKLLKWHKEQQKQEQDIRSFINVCNNYLVGKQVKYDNIKFRIYIALERQSINPNKSSQEPDNEEIELKMLSSGEKQIVSLFSHLYLSDTSGYFVIIDEPELSLSVPWQKRFLPDILHSGRCNGLIAVTHSPFIFDNELDSYTHSLTEFISQ